MSPNKFNDKDSISLTLHKKQKNIFITYLSQESNIMYHPKWVTLNPRRFI